MGDLCALFGASKQAYYKHEDENIERLAIPRFIIEFVRDVREEDPAIGGEKLWVMYSQYFGKRYRIGRDAFLKVLKRYNLMLKAPRKSCRTTDSTHDLPTYPNLIKDFAINRSDQVWVSDITYIRLREDDFCFLSLVTDAYDHEIVGAYVGPTLATVHTIEALKQACRKRNIQNTEGLTHHSDRGVQYASYMYVNELKQKRIRISMTENGDPKENAIAERVNGILKKEFLNQYSFETIELVRQAVQQAVTFYNTKRPHRSLDMLTPQQAFGKTGMIKKRWTSYKDKYREACPQ